MHGASRFYKRNCYKVRLITSLLALLIFFMGGVAYAGNDKYAALVMDSDTNRVLFARNADKLLHPASLTKMMTLLLTFEAIKNGELNPDQRIRISRHAASMVPSKLGLAPGSSIKVKHAIPVLVTKSANDVAVALAETIAGSESRFAMQMTRKAHDIGMNRTRFRNASGLHHPQQISTARDMARLGQYMIRQYPGYYNHFDRLRFRYDGEIYRNHNRMLGNYRGMDGIKTGYISAAGFNLVASVERGNERLIGVVFGGRSAQTRNAHMRDILNRGFRQMRAMQVAANAPIPERKPGQFRRVASRGNSFFPPEKPRGGSIAAKGSKSGNPLRKIAKLRDIVSTERFGALFGQGDYDARRAERMRTGIITVAAHTGDDGQNMDIESFLHSHQDNQKLQAGQKRARTFSSANSNVIRDKNEQWSIQLGAYKSRAQTEQILRQAGKKLRRRYQSSINALIAPRRAGDGDGWLYRARFTGLSKRKARNACQLFSSCMTIAPAR